MIRWMGRGNIYGTARIVVFKDGIITGDRPDLAIQNKNTGTQIYLDGDYRVDRFNRHIWKHYIELVMDLVAKGRYFYN